MAEEDESPAPATTPQPETTQQPEPPPPRDTSDRSWQTLNINPENIKKG